MSEPGAALLVADHDERGEGEAASALHHLGYAVDVHELVDELARLALFAPAAAVTTIPSFTFCHLTLSLCASSWMMRVP
jgi:hypothetical protein